MKKYVLVLAVGAAVSGCALKSDIRRVEDQLTEMRESAARADSVRAVALARILDQLDAFNAEIRDSLRVQRTTIMGLQGSVRTDLTQVLRNMVAMQELMGQSQAGLDQLRRDLDQRLQDIASQPAPADSAGALPPDRVQVAGPGPEESYSMGMQQYRQNSRATARIAFHRVVNLFPDHQQAPDAMFFIAESWEEEQPDSAVAYYELLIATYTQDDRAAGALWKLGLMAERQDNASEARLHFQRLVTSFPDSDEAVLAREKLSGIDPFRR